MSTGFAVILCWQIEAVSNGMLKWMVVLCLPVPGGGPPGVVVDHRISSEFLVSFINFDVSERGNAKEETERFTVSWEDRGWSIVICEYPSGSAGWGSKIWSVQEEFGEELGNVDAGIGDLEIADMPSNHKKKRNSLFLEDYEVLDTENLWPLSAWSNKQKSTNWMNKTKLWR